LEKEAATVSVVLSKNENVKIKHFLGEKILKVLAVF
jgi:hypothetical protein